MWIIHDINVTCIAFQESYAFGGLNYFLNELRAKTSQTKLLRIVFSGGIQPVSAGDYLIPFSD
jgi:hypothetical protein